MSKNSKIDNFLLWILAYDTIYPKESVFVVII